MRNFWLSIFVFVCVISWADVVLERKTTLSSKDALGREKILKRRDSLYIKGQNFRIEDKTFGNVLIVRGDKKILWKIDTLRDTYSELSFDKISELKGGIIDELKQAKANVEGSDDEKQLDKLLNDLGELPLSAKIMVENIADETEVVAGVKCTHKKVIVDGIVKIDGYFADAMPDGENYIRTLGDASAFPKVLCGEIDKLKGTMLKGDMRYTLFSDRVVDSSETLYISRDEINPKEFELPQGLTKVPLIGFEKAQNGKKEELVRDVPVKGDKDKEKDNQSH